jgi:hypothetical protein
MVLAALCHGLRECESVDRVFALDRCKESLRLNGNCLLRFDSMCHHLCTPDNADFLRDDAMFSGDR